MDSEYIELCQEIYDKTKWDVPLDWDKDTTLNFAHICYEWDDNGYRTGEKWIANNYTIYMASEERQKICPAYTLEYLFTKLPPVYKDGYITVGEAVGLWGAWYQDGLTKKVIDSELADTPLKAVLKLTLLLHDRGEIQ